MELCEPDVEKGCLGATWFCLKMDDQCRMRLEEMRYSVFLQRLF